MKVKNLLLCGAVCTLLTGYAQEAIRPEIKNLSSPVVDADARSITFNLSAPNAKSVVLSGNILRGVTDTLPDGSVKKVDALKMNKNEKDGIWTVTVKDIAPDLYTYKFIADGLEVVDPLNAYVVRDVKNVSNMVYMPGEQSNLFLPANVPHGSVESVWYDSGFKGKQRRLSVYLPSDYYSSDPERRFPVLYLLHGMGGDETAWLELGRATEILDNLIAQGRIEPMIVVMPNGNISREAVPGKDEYALSQPDFYLPNTMDGEFEKHFPEIVDFVSKRYRTRPEKESNAIAGLSMGGFHSRVISAQYPDLFDYVGLFSAAIDPREFNEKELPEIYRNLNEKINRQFDSPILYYIAIGKDDFLYDANKNYRSKLDSNKFPYIYNETSGGHEWSNWRQYLIDFLPRLFRSSAD